MMAETPGERLMREFPNIEASVVSMILENVNYNAEKASELLLEMSGLAVAETEFPALGAPGRHLDDFPSVEVAWGRQKPLRLSTSGNFPRRKYSALIFH